jgi:hypothetical protein
MSFTKLSPGTESTLQEILEALGGQSGVDVILQPSSVNLADTNETDVIAAPGAGFALYLTSFIATNNSNSVEQITISNGVTDYVGDMAANGGVFILPIKKFLTAGTNVAWTAQLTSGVSSVNVTATALKVAV